MVNAVGPPQACTTAGKPAVRVLEYGSHWLSGPSLPWQPCRAPGLDLQQLGAGGNQATPVGISRAVTAQLLICMAAGGAVLSLSRTRCRNGDQGH